MRTNTTNTIYAIVAILLTMASVAACRNQLKHLAVDRHQIMPYVTCSGRTVDSLLAIADTVFSRTDTYQLRDLNMGESYMNDDIREVYNDTIPLVVALFDTYARMVNSGMDEASAAFVWHEVATSQMKHFFEETGGKWSNPNGSETVFRIIDSMMGTYGAGNQYDMNSAAWRSTLPIDYRLIATYKRLMDLCKDTDVVKLVNEDYMYTMKTFREYCSSSDEWYSDLLREQGEMFQILLNSKFEYVRRLVNRYKKGSISNSMVKASLKEHRVIWFNHEVKLTTGTFPICGK